MIVEDIQVTTRSNLACAEHLLREDTYSNWKSESVWLKPGMIDDTNLRMAVENLLLRATISQLSSVINQNPTWGRLGGGWAPDSEQLWMQYLDSVINGDTPIFQLVKHSDLSHLPVPLVVDALSKYPKSDSDCWDILVPKTLRDQGARGIHFVEYVSRFPSGAEKCIVSKTRATIRDLARRHMSRKITYSDSAIGFGSVEYEEKAIVSVCCWRESQRHPIDCLSLDSQKRTYNWDRHVHFNTAVIIEKLV